MGHYRDLRVLKTLIEEGERLGLDFSQLEEKISECLKNQESGIIKIVLLGAFSDGKTTAIAGMLGKVEDNMLIDEDESSNELSVYHLEGLGRHYEIVDTPGLFGTKEKEIGGANIKFSEITERFISEAHIIIYVCNSINTLKDSHKDIIKKVLRDYGKLESSIFVINRMDDVADTNDEEEYADISAVKRGTFINRLRQVIGLTAEEESRLKIACIAANPKSKGLEHWLRKPEEYRKRSHIGQLESCVSAVVANSDVDELRLSTNDAVAKDLSQHIALSVSTQIADLTHVMNVVSSSLKGLETDLSIAKDEISENKQEMTNSLEELRKNLFGMINHIGLLEDMQAFLEEEIGVTEGKVDFNLVTRKINLILEKCGNQNDLSLQTKVMEFERQFKAQEELIDKGIKSGLEGMKQITNKGVLKFRNIFLKGVKFKPYQAVKIAKGIGIAAVALDIFVEIWKQYKKYKEAKKLAECKASIKSGLSDLFNQVYQLFEKKEDYYKNFAPTYLDLLQMVNETREELKKVSDQLADLNAYKSRFKNWLGSEIADVEFEDIK